MILMIRTDKPEAEIGVIDSTGNQIDYCSWQAHKHLSETIHKKIKELLAHNAIELSQLSGIIFFEGPGSFTGLRIGAAIANAFASSLAIPVVSSGGKNWTEQGQSLLMTDTPRGAVPVYDSEAKTTRQKK